MGESAVARGYAEASLGDHGEGITQIRSGISALHEIGNWHHRSHWLGLLAAAYLEAGAYRDAVAVLDEALEVVAVTQEGYYAQELERLEASILDKVNSTKLTFAFRRRLCGGGHGSEVA